jgi:arabinofuranosyltransferase
MVMAMRRASANSLPSGEGRRDAVVVASPAVDAPSASAAGRRSVMAALLVAAVGFVFWRAWVCDDAFITFRHVANCLAGYGPVFNVGERVQGFTHPLWFLLLLAAAPVFSVYSAAVAAGLASTAAIILVLARLFRGRNDSSPILIAAVAVLLSSKTFVEFQTSGLETSLTNLLTVLLFAAILRHAGGSGTPRVEIVALLCSLLLLTRLDQLFICGPIMAWASVRVVSGAGRGHRWQFLAAMTPLLLWYGFATLYYGTPLPNTAYAKVALPLTVALAQGASYLWDYAWCEPTHALIVALVLAGGIVWSAPSVIRKRPGATGVLCLVLGLWLQCVYVLGVVGDFMRGRFLLSTLVGATVMASWLVQGILAPWHGRRILGRPVSLAAVAVLLAGASSLIDVKPRLAVTDERTGIADEYSHYAGRWDQNRFRPPDPYAKPYNRGAVEFGRALERYSRACGPVTIAWRAMGILPYYAGPGVRVIDVFGLTDAFVARCPPSPGSRIGHIQRVIPRAYFESHGTLGYLPGWDRRIRTLDPTLLADAQAMTRAARWDDPAAFQHWQRVHRMISGDLFSWGRLADIPSYALGRW